MHASRPDHPPGTLLGSYRVLGSLGSGGMAEVVLAQHIREPRKRVAIKVVRRELVSPNVNARLKTEQKILAKLDHPNIAKFLDRGTTSNGVPYIVMEYVAGEPIDSHCDRRSLTLEQRLRLFLQVCAAVHEAHLIRIVHRDLKPPNILVTSEGVPKLLDFGIAKVLDDLQTLQTLAITQAGYRMLTPEYASPEQIRCESITPASDIYVLGVVLYELVSGCRPFELQGASPTEVERIVCEQGVMAPSAALGRSLAAQAHRIAACRCLQWQDLCHQLRGQLDAIVMAAMRREPHARYETAALLARDIERYLQGEPISPPRDSRGTGDSALRRWVRGVSSALGFSKN